MTVCRQSPAEQTPHPRFVFDDEKGERGSGHRPEDVTAGTTASLPLGVLQVPISCESPWRIGIGQGRASPVQPSPSFIVAVRVTPPKLDETVFAVRSMTIATS